MQIYCGLCRTKTGTRNPEQKTMRNGQARVTGVCTVCRTPKSQFGTLPVD